MEKTNRKINANTNIYCFIIKLSNSNSKNNNNNNKYCVHVIKTIIYIDIFIGLAHA